ncbi:hypothetical protein JW766_04645 [Candidatus Dojkabacteria bacterium]|nr:hypothetical protein [Candidatus Dojkabacteria bacterium]
MPKRSDSKYNSQQAIYYQNKKAKDFQSYAFMLIDDFGLGIMPIGGRTENKKFKVELTFSSKEVESLLTYGLTDKEYPQSLCNVVCDFVERCTKLLVYYGDVYYEIVYYYPSKDKDKPNGFCLIDIPNYSLKNIFGKCFQIIPSEVRTSYKIEKRYISFPKDRIVKFPFPRLLGGKRKIVKILNELNWIGKHTTSPEFVFKEGLDSIKQTFFDYEAFRKIYDTKVAKLTRGLGWTARSMYKNRMTEYYYLYRYVKFHGTKAILREYIIDKLNEALTRIGKELNFETQIGIRGLLSPADCDNYLRKLEREEIGFNELLDIISKDI